MKITNVEAIVVGAGWRPWNFVKVETDEGIVGYGECSVARGPLAVAGAVEDLKPLLVGTDPRAYEMRFWDMARNAIQGPLGVRAKAMAGIELALIDIKAKALGISVVELFGGQPVTGCGCTGPTAARPGPCIRTWALRQYGV